MDLKKKERETHCSRDIFWNVAGTGLKARELTYMEQTLNSVALSLNNYNFITSSNY